VRATSSPGFTPGASLTDAFLLIVGLDSGGTFISGMMDRLQKY